MNENYKKCLRCGTDITKLVELGYTPKHGFKPLCIDCIFPGYVMVDWSDIAICFKDAKVFIYGQFDGKPVLYGPHSVHNTQNHELINSKGTVFRNNKDAMIMAFNPKDIAKNEEKRYSHLK